MTPSELRDCLRQYLPEQDVLPVCELFVEFLRSNEVNRKEVRHTDIKEVHEILTCEMIQKMKYQPAPETFKPDIYKHGPNSEGTLLYMVEPDEIDCNDRNFSDADPGL